MQLQTDPFAWEIMENPKPHTIKYSYGDRLSTMPPAFLVDRYSITNGVDVRADYLKYNIVGGFGKFVQANVQYNVPMYKNLYRYWRDDPRCVYNIKDYLNQTRLAIGTMSCVYNDDFIKMDKWRRFAPELKKVLTHTKSKFTSLAYDHFKDMTLSYGPHTYNYVSTHGRSHPIPGSSWEQILAQGLMPRLYDFTKESFKIVKDNWWTEGNFAHNPKHLGMGSRARTPSDLLLAYQIYCYLVRSRRVGFVPGMSSFGAFNPHQNQVDRLQAVFDFFEQRWGCKIVSPKTIGGQVYTMIQDAMKEGKEIKHFDVAGMELITIPLISGFIKKRTFGLGAMTFQNLDWIELLSGVFPTTDWNIIAQLILLDYLIIESPELIVILGDDGTIIGGKLRKCILYERQPADDAINRTLGLSISTKLIHPTGLNITIDSAAKRIDVERNRTKVIRNKMPMPERQIVLNLFKGYVNDIPFSDILRKSPSMDGFYSPKNYAIALGLKAAKK